MAKRLNLKDGDLVPGLPDGWQVRVVEDREKVRRVARWMAGKRIYLIEKRPDFAYATLHGDRYATSVAEVGGIIARAERARLRDEIGRAALLAAGQQKLAALRGLFVREGEGSLPERARAQAAACRAEADALLEKARALRSEAADLDALVTLHEKGVVLGEIETAGGSRTGQTFTVAQLEAEV